MIPLEYIGALSAVFGMLILLLFAFRKVSSTPVTKKEASKPKSNATVVKKKKVNKTKNDEKSMENAEVEEILKKEISRSAGMSTDVFTPQPTTIGESQEVRKRQTAQPKPIASSTSSGAKKQRNADASASFQGNNSSTLEDGFKPVSTVPSRTTKPKEKVRSPHADFEIDEEMEKKLAAFFSRSERRNKAGITLSAPGAPTDAEQRGSYARVKEDFSLQSKW